MTTYPMGERAGPATLSFQEERAAWAQERERLLSMVAQQQRVAQTGLVTSGLVHEVSNHVMLINGLAYMALRGCDPAKWKSTLGQIQERCDEISETMRTVLDFVGRRQEGRLESFRVSGVLEEAARLLRPLALAKSIGIDRQVRHDAVLLGERRLLVQALVNLASNAVRAYDGATGRIRLSASSSDGTRCLIDVEDRGGGIPEHLRHRLFRPFVTGHASSGGSGLGLFLVRQVVRRMGGTIRVESSRFGTKIRLDLPAGGTASG